MLHVISNAKNHLFSVEAEFFRKGSLLLFGLVIKIFCFESNLDQTWSDCSTHEYYNLTLFGQDWTQNKKDLLQGQKVVRIPFLKNVASNVHVLAPFT